MTWVNPNRGIELLRTGLIQYQMEKINMFYGGKMAKEYLLKAYTLETRRQNALNALDEEG